MKKLTFITVLSCCTLLIGCNQSGDGATNSAQTDTEQPAADSPILPVGGEQPALSPDVLLTVNGQPVSRTLFGLYFKERVRDPAKASDNPQLQMKVLNELSNLLILSQDAEQKQLDKSAEVEATLTLFRAKLLTQAAIQRHLKEHQPTEADYQKLYDAEYANKSSTEFKARHILLKEEEKAKEIIALLQQGGDFAELAKTHSTGPTGANGGDLGWFDSEQMVKPFADAVQAMEKGKYSEAPVKTQFGWHVILLEDSRDLPAPSLDAVRSELTTRLQQQVLADYIQELRAKTKLHYNEQQKPAKEKAAQASGES